MKHYFNPSKIVRIESQQAVDGHQPRIVIDLEGDSFAVIKCDTIEEADQRAQKLAKLLDFVTV